MSKIPMYPIPDDLAAVIVHGMKPWPDMSKASKQFLRVLRTIKTVDQLKLSENNYLHYLKITLWLEEFKNILEMRKYDMFDQELRRAHIHSSFKIHVEGLMEERPSVKVNDYVDVIDAFTNITYKLKVTVVLDQDIIALASDRLCRDYRSEKRYHIKFRFNNFPYRCSHFGLTLMHVFNLASYLFPQSIKSIKYVDSDLEWFNVAVRNNPEQKQCIYNIINKSSLGAPYVLYGPPGTGKTATVVEAVCQARNLPTCKRILICTPSNTSADLITKRLLTYLPKEDLHRMYSFSKVASTIDENIVDCSNCVDGEIKMFSVAELPRIIITTLVTSTRLLLLGLEATAFSYIFIDEAGQATVPETMIPFALLSSAQKHQKGRLHGQIVLAGDHQQLGPVMRSKLAESLLGKSMLERMMSMKPYSEYNSRYVTKLLKNYRSHPSLIHISNELFYESALIPCRNDRKGEDWVGLPNPKFPMIFDAVRGTEMSNDRSPSIYNLLEIEKVMYYVDLLIGSKLGNSIVRQEDIGIVTPYAAQKLKLQWKLKNSNLSDIEIGTVQLFQGKEKEVIILSAVRSRTFQHKDRYHVGFLSDPKRFNVALTRAKSLLIVIGHPEILQVDVYWNRLINYCRQNNAYCSDESELKTHQYQPLQQTSNLIVEINKKFTSGNTSKLNNSTNDIEKGKNISWSNKNSHIDSSEYMKRNISTNDIENARSSDKVVNNGKNILLFNNFNNSNIGTLKNKPDSSSLFVPTSDLKKTECNKNDYRKDHGRRRNNKCLIL